MGAVRGWTLLLIFILLYNFGNGDNTCSTKGVKYPKFLPAPKPMDIATIRKTLTKGVWPQLYLHYTLDTDIAFIDAVQVRLKFELSNDGCTLFRTFSFRTNVTGECLTFDQVYKKSPKAKGMGIFLREQDNSMRQERYFSSCPDKYFWIWICRDYKTIKRRQCRGDVYLGLHAREPANQVPFDMAAKDIRKYGISFQDPRFKITHSGIPCEM